MRQFTIALLSLTLIPANCGWSQVAVPAGTENAVPAELAEADVAPAAELEAAITELEAAHAQNYNTLVTIIDKVPAEARPALEQALENSKRGYLQARANRERTTAMRQSKASARLAKSRGQGGPQGGQGKPTHPGQAGKPTQPGQFGQNQPQSAIRTAQVPEHPNSRPATAGPQNSGEQNSGAQAGRAQNAGQARGPVRR